MKKQKISTLNELTRNRYINPLYSPVWILNIEKIEVKQSYFLKIYLLINLDIYKIKEITVLIPELKQNLEVNEFKISEKYNDPNVMGCVLKLPVNVENLSDISILSIKYDNNFERFESQEHARLSFYKNSNDVFAVKYLNNINGDFVVFPEENSEYWKCSCGKINKTRDNECLNCFRDKNNIFGFTSNMVNSLDLAIFHFLKEVDFNIHIDFDENLKQIFDGSKTINKRKNISQDLENKLKREYESKLREYINDFKTNHNIYLNKSISIEENLENYYSKMNIPVIYYELIFNDLEIKKILKEYEIIIRNKENNKKKLKNIIVSITILIIMIFALSQTILKSTIDSYFSELSEKRSIEISEKWSGKWCVIERNGGSYSYEDCITINVKNKEIIFYFPTSFIHDYNPKTNIANIKEATFSKLTLADWPVDTLTDGEHYFTFINNNEIQSHFTGSRVVGSTYSKQ